MEETFEKLAETEQASMYGSSVTSYGLQPVTYLKELIDGAKSNMHFIQWVREDILPPGTHQLSIPKRKQYKGYYGATWNTAGDEVQGGSSTGTGPYANTIADISWTTADNYDNVTAIPVPVIVGRALQKYNLDVNAVNYVEEVKNDLMYEVADRIEFSISTALGDATNSTSTVAGAQTLYGGDATSSATLAAGDILTTDLIAKAARKLSDLQFGYRASTTYGAETLLAISSYRKNPWQNTPDDPFVLFIGPAQEEALRKDSQFVNASEYGDDTIVKNGEIGKIRYLGIRIVVSNHLERTAASGTAPDTQTAAVATTRCLLVKPKKALSVVYGKKPELKVWDYNEREQVRISVVMYLATVVIHPDAVIKVDVADA